MFIGCKTKFHNPCSNNDAVLMAVPAVHSPKAKQVPRENGFFMLQIKDAAQVIMDDK